MDVESNGKLPHYSPKKKVMATHRRSSTEIRNRIGQAKTTFRKMKNILCNMTLSLEVRKRVLQCYITPILTYGCESWTINKLESGKLEATEMWFYRRMLRIPWTARKTNVEVFKESNAKRSLINNIRKRQSSFFGHFMRQGGSENIVTTGDRKSVV